MTDCLACFRLLYRLGIGWVRPGVPLTLSDIFIATSQPLGTSIPGSWDTHDSTTYVSNITGCCSQHLLGEQILLLLTSQAQRWSQVSSASQTAALPSARAGRAEGNKRDTGIPCAGTATQARSAPGVSTPVGLPGSTPHRSSLSLSCLCPSVASCPANTAICCVLCTITFPSPAETPTHNIYTNIRIIES